MIFSDDVRKLNPELAGLPRHAIPRVLLEHALFYVDGFDSQLERDFACELHARGVEFRPHGLTFNLPGGVTYTPDFIEWPYTPLVSGIVVYEVKGNLKQKNARDSRTRFKLAAGLYPCFRWMWVTRERSGRWVETRFTVPAGTP